MVARLVFTRQVVRYVPSRITPGLTLRPLSNMFTKV
jgi:hypothetical protein